MSVLILNITTGRPTSYLTQNFETAGGSSQIAQRIVDYVNRVFTGNELAQDSTHPPSIQVQVQNNMTQASGSFALTTVVATNTCSINGVTFTAVSSGATPSANQFRQGFTDTLTAVNLAAAINASASALVSGYVTAVASGTSVNVFSAFYGTAGNMTAIASGQGTIVVAPGARLTLGAGDSRSQTLSF